MEQVCRTCWFKGPALAQVGDLDDPGAAIVVDTGLSVCTALRHLGSVRVGPRDGILATVSVRQSQTTRSSTPSWQLVPVTPPASARRRWTARGSVPHSF